MAGTRHLRLAPLLDHRKRVEEEKQRLFAARQSARDRSLRELEYLTAALHSRTHELGEPGRVLPAYELRVQDAHLRYLEGAIHAQCHHAAALEASLEHAREELITAARARRIIEKLEERRRRALDEERERREQVELEDANARREARLRPSRKNGAVIELTRLNGQPVIVNCDLIESIEENGDTVITLTTGNALVVRNRMHEIQRKVVAFKREIFGPSEPGA
jgi:flagellar protein FlbD